MRALIFDTVYLLYLRSPLRADGLVQPESAMRRETFAVVGWAEKNGKFDGVYLGRNDEGELAHGGKVERGFSEEDERNLLARVRPLRIKKQPIAAPLVP
jgi:ATP-dependent DNA ligase